MPRAPVPARRGGNTGRGGRPAERAGVLGVPRRRFGSRANLWVSPIGTIWPLGSTNVPNGPFPWAPVEAPLCQRAGWRDRPQGHASPVAGAPRPQASRLLVGPPAGGLCRGQEWGEVNPQPPASPRRPRQRHEWWPAGARPGASGPQQPRLVDKSTWQLSALLGSPLTPPTAGPRPARLREARGARAPRETRRGAEEAGTMSPRGGGRAPQVLGRRPPAPAGWSCSSHAPGPFPPGSRQGPPRDGLRAPS